MKLVIDIPEEIVESVKYGNVYIAGTRSNGKTILCKITDAIANATPLPKGHGRLIDADDFLTLFRDGTEGYDCATYTRYEIGEILEKDAPTIIDAESEDKE